MALRHYDAQRFLPQQQCAQRFLTLTGQRTCERYGEATFGHHFPDALGRAFLKMHGDFGKTPPVFMQQTTEKGLRGRPDVAEA